MKTKKTAPLGGWGGVAIMKHCLCVVYSTRNRHSSVICGSQGCEWEKIVISSNHYLWIGNSKAPILKLTESGNLERRWLTNLVEKKKTSPVFVYFTFEWIWNCIFSRVAFAKQIEPFMSVHHCSFNWINVCYIFTSISLWKDREKWGKFWGLRTISRLSWLLCILFSEEAI